MKGQWIIKEVYFEDGFPRIIRDIERETPEITPDVKPVQVSPLEFIAAVFDKEFLYGKPIMWAEWPNRARREK